MMRRVVDFVQNWWVLGLGGGLALFIIYGIIQIGLARDFCYARGDEYANAYFGGKVACIETTNGTRRVVMHQRK